MKKSTETKMTPIAPTFSTEVKGSGCCCPLRRGLQGRWPRAGHQGRGVGHVGLCFRAEVPAGGRFGIVLLRLAPVSVGFSSHGEHFKT